MMMMMMNCFCSIVDRRKAFSLISRQYHCQRSSPSQIFDTPRAGFEPAQNLSSGFDEWSCAVVITITPRCHFIIIETNFQTENPIKIFFYKEKDQLLFSFKKNIRTPWYQIVKGTSPLALSMKFCIMSNFSALQLMPMVRFSFNTLPC